MADGSKAASGTRVKPRRGGRKVWMVGLLAASAALYVLPGMLMEEPNIAPGPALDDVFASPFHVTNRSRIPIEHLQFGCVLQKAEDSDGNEMSDATLAYATADASRLRQDEWFGIVCPITVAAQSRLGKAHVIVEGSYRPSIYPRWMERMAPFQKGREQHFNLVRDRDGHSHWVYPGPL